MGTLFRAFGMRFAIYSNEHGPPHVHVYGGGGEAKVLLLENGEARVDWARRLTRAQMRQALLAIEARRNLLDEAWSNRDD